MLPLLILTSQLILFLLFNSLYLWLRVPKRFPPGPFLPLPLLRHLPWSRFYGLSPLQALTKAREIHGDVFSVHIGYKRVVLVADVEKARSLFARRIYCSSEETVLNQAREGKYGVNFINGHVYQLQRRIFMEVSRSTYFKDASIESTLDLVWPQLESAMSLGGDVTFEALEPPFLRFMVHAFVDPGLYEPGESLASFNLARFFGTQWSEPQMWFRSRAVRRLAPEWSGFKQAMDARRRTYEEFEKIVKLHEENPSEERNDFIDLYLKKIVSLQDKEESLRGEDGRKCLLASLDNILLGMDDLIISLNHNLYFLARNPHLQERIRRELDDDDYSAAGGGGGPLLKAFLMEVQRCASLVGLGVPHQVEGGKEPLEVAGFVIPTGTDVYPCLRLVHFDKEHWGDPENFRPERFLEGDSPLVVVRTVPHWIPFQVGLHACPAGRSNYAMKAMSKIVSRILSRYRVHFSGFVMEGGKDDQAAWTIPKGFSRGVAGDENGMVFLGMALIMPEHYRMRFEKVQKKDRYENVDFIPAPRGI